MILLLSAGVFVSRKVVIIGGSLLRMRYEFPLSVHNMHPPFGNFALLSLLCWCRQSPLHMVFTYGIHLPSRPHFIENAKFDNMYPSFQSNIPHLTKIKNNSPISRVRSLQHFCGGRDHLGGCIIHLLWMFPLSLRNMHSPFRNLASLPLVCRRV